MRTWRRILILGGARSGKSAFAEQLAVQCGEPVLYIATATATDEEMAQRIAIHRARRPATWRTIEVAMDVAARAAVERKEARTLLVEDLTLLLSNLMADNEATAEKLAMHNVGALAEIGANVIFVSNEVGMGIVPEYPLGRQFRDALGRVNQSAAAACDEVHLLVAGLPLRLK